MASEEAPDLDEIFARLCDVAERQTRFAEELTSILQRLRRAEDGLQRVTQAVSEMNNDRDGLQRAVMRHVEALQQSLSKEMDVLRRNDQSQNQVLSQQTEKLDVLLEAEKARKLRDMVLKDLAQETNRKAEDTNRRVAIWHNWVGIGSGILGILAIFVTALLWIAKH